MKRFAAVLLTALGVLTGLARWIDLVNFTDPVTEFVTVGSVWLRYALVLALVLVAALASLLAGRGPASGGTRPAVQTALLFGCCAAFAALAAGQLLAAGLTGLPMTLLCLLAAWWLACLGLAGRQGECPAGGAFGGIAGTVWFYALTLQRFAQNSSSYYRVGPVFRLLAALLALVFAAALMRAAVRPGQLRRRKLAFSGLACFYTCSCVQLPQAVYGWMTGSFTAADLAQDAALALLGLLGAAVAAQQIAGAQPVAQPPEVAQNGAQNG